MGKRFPFVLALAAGALLVGSAVAAPAHGLEVFWIDVEGGAATLVVTPAGESVLVDAGNPGGRDAERIHRVATEVAGLKRIDHLVVTHFHRDHFGGVAELARLMPIGVLHERDLAAAPEKERAQPDLEAYRRAAVGRRVPIRVGERIALRQARGAAPVFVEVLGADARFRDAKHAPDNASACGDGQAHETDLSDNGNSVVLLVGVGSFRLFDGGDLTWNREAELVCPRDRVGAVDVFQADHHGLDLSNNPVLVRTLAPTVAVVNNGPRKGNEAATVATLRAARSIAAVYQVHRDVRADERNTAAERIANSQESCAGEHIRLSADPRGLTYVVSVPATGHRATFETHRR